VTKVFCAYQHAFVLTARDEVFSFGRNSKGQLGVGNTIEQTSPQKVRLLCGRRVCLMAGGMEFSLALTETDEVYSFGLGSAGQLGLGYTTAKEQTPQRAEGLCGLGITSMVCGRNHTLIHTRADEVWGFGDNSKGQLGLTSSLTAASPVRLEELCRRDVAQLACGYYYSMVLLRGGELYAFGDNSMGQLGTGGDDVERAPALVEVLR
jgi:alpha-tubulin suppressor-like RCC1 family protein